MRVVQKSIRSFGTLNAQYLANKNKNAVRFQAQNLSWDFEVLEYHSKAFAKGLRSLNFSDSKKSFKVDDNFLIRTPSSQQAEAFVSKVGTANINANLFISKATSVQELDHELSSHKINGLIFEPTLPLGEDLLMDGIYSLIPEARNLLQGDQLKPSKYNNLKMLIQTNFYTFPGVFKYRVILLLFLEHF